MTDEQHNVLSVAVPMVSFIEQTDRIAFDMPFACVVSVIAFNT